MVSTIRLYVDASYAVVVMAVVAIISGAITAGVTGDTPRSLQVALAMFAITGALLIIRLWLVMRRRLATEMTATADDSGHSD